ncbi:DNA-processing protein DprA [Bifidobacterium simiarum]|uniref:DNA-processing protein DprA n=1 Tax=Bifidobacterium simiarum TaxID=2045441 RepID=UPI001BDD5C00|nr:DNA-processing protein DprA [Bifidobacterium simiarum]MBT1167289.1 DNA-processing protein DprA [Bifidobacterium simiarum]
MNGDAMARAVLTFATDGPDALMYALLKGAENATQALTLVLRSTLAEPPWWLVGADREGFPDNDRMLERLFIVGTAKWGRRVGPKELESFRHALTRWRDRLLRLPLGDYGALAGVMTHDDQWIITPESPCWPHQLTDLAIRSDWAPPLCLWGMGDPSSLVSCEAPVAVVGSRDANDYGRFVARNAGLHAARDGHLLVSGGAMGADAAAHWGALAARRERENGDDPDRAGRTVAVFAGGLDHRGPARNLPLFDAMLAERGALVSEMPPGTIPEARRFLLRNRIIAALSDVIIVAQARHRSGALSTATWAAEMSRKVYAAPGDIDEPFNTGCNRLIHEGKAILLHSATDIGECCHPSHLPCEPNGRNEPDGRGKPAGRGAGTADPAPSTTEAAGESDGDDRGASMVLTAVRSCARRHVPATVDEIMRYLSAKPATATVSVGGLHALLGLMESRGMIRMGDDGIVRLRSASAAR